MNIFVICFLVCLSVSAFATDQHVDGYCDGLTDKCVNGLTNMDTDPVASLSIKYKCIVTVGTPCIIEIKKKNRELKTKTKKAMKGYLKKMLGKIWKRIEFTKAKI